MLDVANDPYLEARDGNYYVGKTRVTLDTVVLLWKDGKTPEYIHEHFPTVPLASVYGVVAYYLSHQEDVDAYLADLDEKARHLRAEAEQANPELYSRLRARLAANREGEPTDLEPHGDQDSSQVERRPA